MNTKKFLLTVMLLSSLLGGAGFSSVHAAKAYALWCEGNKTVYYVYGETAYAAGGTYDGQTITQVFNDKIAYWVEDEEEINGGYYDWDADITSQVQTVVLDASYCTSKPTNLACLFGGMSNLTKIVGLENLDTSEATTMNCMFYECNSLTSIDVNHFNTSKVTDLGGMFASCVNMTELKGLDHFDTSKVIFMNDMFYACSELTSIDVSHFNTSKVQYMSVMFAECKKLQSLDLSHFDTSNVKEFIGMFSSCLALKSVNLSSFDTSKATSMSSMFSHCSNFKSLDVTNFNTGNVESMGSMFAFCNKLKSLDLRNFNTTKVSDMWSMFSNDLELTTIFCDDSWSATKSDYMFYNCPKLVGAIAYDKNKTTVEYANPTTGYFTTTTTVIHTTMQFSSTTATVTFGQAFTPPTLTIAPAGLPVTYESSEPTVAKVDASTGAVTLLHSGEANITASFAGDDKYNAASASYKLTVNAKNLGLSIGGVVMNSDYLIDNTELTAALDGILTAGTVTLTSEPNYYDLTLTLNDAKLQSGTKTTLANYGSLTLVLKGSSELTSSGTSTATLVNGENKVLTITGSGQLKVTGYSIGTENRGALTLDGATLETVGRAIGFYSVANSHPSILRGTLKATGSERGSIECLNGLVLANSVKITQPLGAYFDRESHFVVDETGYAVKTQVTITDGAAASGLAFSAETATVKYGTTPTLPTLANPNNLAVTYKSSDTSVATVDAEGKVTLVKPGETVITASFAGSADYLAGSASYTLTVAKGDPSLSYSEATASVVFGAELSAPTLTVTPESLKDKVKITSSNESVAKITGLGDVTVVGAGETTIKAAFAGDDYYNAAEASYKLTVTAAAATLAFAQTDCSTTVGASFNSPELSRTPASLKVKYSSSNTDLATVSEETGIVVAKAEGVVTITATSADVSYTGSASYKLTITRSASGLQFASATATATYGSPFTAPELNNEHALTVKYESSNTAVATVDETTGQVTLLKGGETTITARFAGNDTYEPASASYVLTVNKAKATLTFSQTECKGEVRENLTSPTLTVNPEGLKVKYTSSNPSIARVNDATGVVALDAEGEVTITATVVDDRYEGEASYKVTVLAPPAKGDANGDGVVDEKDILEIKDYIMGSPSEQFRFKAADANSDNVVNIADIVKISNMIIAH